MPNRKHWRPGFTLQPTSSLAQLKHNVHVEWNLKKREEKSFLHCLVFTATRLGKIKANNSSSHSPGFSLGFEKGGKDSLFGLFGLHSNFSLGLIVLCLNKFFNERPLRNANGSGLESAGPSRSWPNTGWGKNKSVCQYGVSSPNERSWLSVHGSKSTVSSPWLV